MDAVQTHKHHAGTSCKKISNIQNEVAAASFVIRIKETA
jgi:hypothetical protein